MAEKEPIHIYRNVLDAGADMVESDAPAAASGTRDLEILFYGMACFHPDGAGYRVLFPNGLEPSHGIPAHAAAVWVRDRSELATARWQWFAWRNDFFLGESDQQLTINGLVTTDLDDNGFKNGYVTILKECDPTFEIGTDPDTVMEMRVDFGTLTVHEVNPRGMLVVRWLVKAEAGAPVRFNFGRNFIDVPPTADQVILANAGSSSGMDENDRHFRLYRKLSSEPDKDLKHKRASKKANTSGGKPKDPTFGYFNPETPDVVCSPVQSKLR